MEDTSFGPKPDRVSSSILFGLAPDGVYLADRVTSTAGALLPHRFTLTTASRGGLLSVALSLASRPVDVINHPVLRSPDFPPDRRLEDDSPATVPPTGDSSDQDDGHTRSGQGSQRN
ncbi:hypothetical protein Pla22_21760 [Rubripirellula amarantea]|uniref:Uncharacterized protein n=1 Tax=Rubripirellula amarantea TaxID=2527999 RepID=A0A5C5WWE1_9BACT|nr:hypothetical protein Pla22_21760 [Rubripirellula amarantea]